MNNQKIKFNILDILNGLQEIRFVPSFKRHLIKSGLLGEFKCFECGITKWNNKPIVLELEHIDGNRNNNKKENLKLLCPNCHSQTSTFRKNNKKKGKIISNEVLIESIKKGDQNLIFLKE